MNSDAHRIHDKPLIFINNIELNIKKHRLQYFVINALDLL